MQTWTTRQDDKALWGPGPWDSEPDKAHWISPSTGFDCLMVRGPLGAWCGYVGVGPDHPWYGRNYYEEDSLSGLDDHVRVHGCVTYAGFCQAGVPEESGICHPGAGKLWWFGFDCAHSGDLIPAMVGYRRLYGWEDPPYREEYRGPEYVGAETESLARQLRELAG